ncbi:MAG: phosphatidylserine decarboxylase family protein [Saprospiraceae bacterium]
MRIHKSGYLTIPIAFFILAGLLLMIYLWLPIWLFFFLLTAAIIFFTLIVRFFRNPIRAIPKEDEKLVYVPADGKVVVIEETVETEYFQQPRIQISIFMSPLNVHVNRNPVAGTVAYYKYHPGKYLVAWHPKSSTENERTTTVIKTKTSSILIRQIAGAVARRILNYNQVDTQVTQGSEMGFIKFGSRVDVFLPLDAKVQVKIGDEVKGNWDVLAQLS